MNFFKRKKQPKSVLICRIPEVENKEDVTTSLGRKFDEYNVLCIFSANYKDIAFQLMPESELSEQLLEQIKSEINK